MGIGDEKRRLRAAMRALSEWPKGKDAAETSRRICALCLGLPEMQAEAPMIGGYLPLAGEVVMESVYETLWSRGGDVAVPGWGAGVGGGYGWVWLRQAESRVKGPDGVEEPQWGRCLGARDRLSVVFVPGVAFDATGGRLGRGGGHYDRLLSMPAVAGALRVGVGYACRMVGRVPAGDRDVPMDVLVTEEGVVRASRDADGQASGAETEAEPREEQSCSGQE